MIVGDESDPHVTSVVSHLDRVRPLVVVDVERLKRMRFSVTNGSAVVETASGHGAVALDEPHRGWIRRPAPAGWDTGMRVGSKAAAVKSAWRTLLLVLLNNPACRWLTSMDELFRAENKMVQYQLLTQAGVTVPCTIVTGSPTLAAEKIGSEVVAKPLGDHEFWINTDSSVAVYARTIDLDDPTVAGILPKAPFILQQRLVARRHFRVVTVGREYSWVFELPAHGLPLDWRESGAAHSSWESIRHEELATRALTVASLMSVGYSSQDWIETNDALYFVDLNPGGQWLFLPQPAADEISERISAWLTGSAVPG